MVTPDHSVEQPTWRPAVPTDKNAPEEVEPTRLSASLRRNIDALRERRKQDMQSAGWEEKLAGAITAFTGSMNFVYLHLAVYGAWMISNVVPQLPHFDPTFVVLAMVASVEAIFLSTFILISQNRAVAVTDKRDDLDLHINLLAEHELTKLISMVAAIAHRLDVHTDAEHELDEITNDVAPEDVLNEIERKNQN